MLTLLLACSGPEGDTAQPLPEIVAPEVLDSMDWRRVQSLTEVLTDDNLGGRIPGSPGHQTAREILVGELEGFDAYLDGTYVQSYPSAPPEGRWMLDAQGQVQPAANDTGHNLVAWLPGSDPVLSSQVIVVMAHYDHLGVTEEGEPFNGAFDDGVAVAAVIEMGRALQQVEMQRSVMLLLTDDEESGLVGAEQFLAEQLVPYEDIVFGVSVDPMGRGVLPDAWPLALMGLERSPELQAEWESLVPYAEVPVAFVHREIIPVFASDQDEFYRADEPRPAVWFTSPGMAFYHTVDDDSETIDYRSVKAQIEWLTQVVVHFANTDTTYAYEGEPEIGAEHAAGARPLIAAVAESSYLTDFERAEVNTLLEELDEVIETGDVSALGNQEAWFFNAIWRLCFELPAEHIGEIPPPFPED